MFCSLKFAVGLSPPLPCCPIHRDRTIIIQKKFSMLGEEDINDLQIYYSKMDGS
jgi:hypothetical protein